jgi:hypothetical protein
MSGNWKFGPVEYTKKANPDGSQSPGYVFPVCAVPHNIITVIPSIDKTTIIESLHVALANEEEYKNYVAGLFTDLLKNNARLFTKSYTSAQCARLTRYDVDYKEPSADSLDGEKYSCMLVPRSIVLFGGKFTIVWNTTIESIVELESDDEVSVSSALADNITTQPPQNIPAHAEEAQLIYEVTDIDSADENESFGNDHDHSRSGHRQMDPRQARDRQRVEEFRLRASLASVKAKRALERYIEKYGEYDTESDESGTTDYTTDDDQSD